MKTTTNTVLISGGSAGIGFEMATLFSEKGNKVIILGRNEEKLKNAASRLSHTTAIVADVSKQEDVDNLVSRISKEFPDLNIVINNAGLAFVYDLAGENVNAVEKAGAEMLTNYLSVIRLNEKLLPLLQQQKEAAIINVSSVVAFVPRISIPTYAASKAALHSYTQSLRMSLAKTGIKVFELMPPLVNTEFAKDIGGENGIAPAIVAENLLQALANDTYEVHVGKTAQLYDLYRSSPAQALLAANGQ